MTTTNLKTIEALEAFLEGNQLAAFSVLGNKTQRYDFVRKTLVKFGYMSRFLSDCVRTSVYGFPGETRVLSGAGNWLMIIREEWHLLKLQLNDS